MAKTKIAEPLKRCLTNSFAVTCEEHAYFIGTVAECAAFAKGYNDHQSIEAGEETVFEIHPVNIVELTKQD